MTIPAWLQRVFDAQGKTNHDGIDRKTRARHCRTCGAAILAGLDSDALAMPALVDPEPLTPVGEALALLADRPTYSLRWTGGHYELDHRTSFHIDGEPAGTGRYSVVATHACGTPPLPTDRHGHTGGPPTAPRLPEEAPF